MKSNFTAEQYPLMFKGIAEQQKVQTEIGVSSAEIELLLEGDCYKAVNQIPYGKQTKKQKAEVEYLERITSFGTDLGNMFEELTLSLGRVPTQKEYADLGTARVKDWWQQSGEASKQQWTAAIEQACFNRQLRGYSSQLVELHTILTLKKLFPEWNFYNSEEIDLLMGVDLIVETEQKRMYVHIFKNSKFAFKAFSWKEKRGGKRGSDGKFKKFNRDFTRHKCLMYEHNPDQPSDTTFYINNNPLFKKQWLQDQLMLFDRSFNFIT